MKNKIVYLSTFLFLFSFISHLYSELPIFGPGSYDSFFSDYKNLIDQAGIDFAAGNKINVNAIKNLLNKIESEFKNKVEKTAYFRKFISEKGFYPKDKINLEGSEAIKEFASVITNEKLGIDDFAQEEFDINKFNDLATRFGKGLVSEEVFQKGKNKFLAQIEKDKKAAAKDVKVVAEAAPISKALDERVKALEAQANDYDQLKQNALKHIKDRLNAFLAKAATISVAKDEVAKFKGYVQQILKDLNESNLNSFNFNKLAILENINDKLGHVQISGFRTSEDKAVLAKIKQDIVQYEAILKDEESKRLAKERKQKAEAGAAQKEEEEAEISSLIKQINDILPSVPQNADKDILVKAFDATKKEVTDRESKTKKLEALLNFSALIKENNFMKIGVAKQRLRLLGIAV